MSPKDVADAITGAKTFLPANEPIDLHTAKRRKKSSHATGDAGARDDGGNPPGTDSRPLIRIRGGLLPEIVDQAEGALLTADLGLYQRGGMLVRPILEKLATSGDREVEGTRLVAVSAVHLRELATMAARWEKWDARSHGWVACDAPMAVAEAYLARGGGWKLPVLVGIIGAPTLRPDGSILDTAGYDVRTGLLFVPPSGLAFAKVPSHPSRAAAEAALAYLGEVLSTFPFVGPADRAVAFSALLTALVRPTLPTAPLHAFSAPVAGSGKSMLVDIAAILATGRPAAVIAQGKVEEETEKRLGAALLAGDVVVSIDNVEGTLGGEMLCQILTQPVVKVRVLGKSLNIETPTTSAMFATGNNLTVAGDLTRRTLVCRLDPGCERPELRDFEYSALDFARTSRAPLVVAALTVLRAAALAAYPEAPPPLGSFSEWSLRVRNALLWLGEADPCATMEATREADPRRAALLAVMQQWSAAIGVERLAVSAIIDVASQSVTDSCPPYRKVYPNAEFREALLAVAGDGGAINGRRLGKWLGANAGRIVDGFRLFQDGIIDGSRQWRLARVGA